MLQVIDPKLSNLLDGRGGLVKTVIQAVLAS